MTDLYLQLRLCILRHKVDDPVNRELKQRRRRQQERQEAIGLD